MLRCLQLSEIRLSNHCTVTGVWERVYSHSAWAKRDHVQGDSEARDEDVMIVSEPQFISCRKEQAADGSRSLDDLGVLASRITCS